MSLLGSEPGSEVGVAIRNWLAKMDPPRTQRWLADFAGIGRPFLSRLIHGQSMLTVPTAVALERACGLDARELLLAQLDEQLTRERGTP